MLNKNFKVINLSLSKGDFELIFETKRIKFNKSTVAEMNFPPYVRMLLDSSGKQFAIQVCDEKDENAIKFSKNKLEQRIGVSVDNPAIRNAIQILMSEWDSSQRQRIEGVYYPSEKSMIYDLRKATIFNGRLKP